MSKPITVNKTARKEYFFEDRLEAGIVLKGFEVKAIKEGHISLKGAFVVPKDGELWLINAHIGPYSKAGEIKGYEPRQTRKLLAKKREISSILGKISQKGLTIVPLKVYINKGKIKLEIAIGRGKTQYDKREDIKKREADRSIARAIRGKN